MLCSGQPVILSIFLWGGGALEVYFSLLEYLSLSDLQAAKDDYDGFVILHGTDTMAYTSSALSFILWDLKKPVILTGSQVRPPYPVWYNTVMNKHYLSWDGPQSQSVSLFLWCEECDIQVYPLDRTPVYQRTITHSAEH